MTLLLYCDEYCYLYNGSYYLESFGLLLIKRYLSTFDTVRVPLRVKKVDTEQELEKNNCLIDDSRISVIPLPYGNGAADFIMHYAKIKRSLKGVCNNIDIAILRLPSIYSFTVLNEALKSGIPYALELVFDCHDGYTSANSILEKFSWRWMHLKQKRACKNAIGISCVTEKYLQQRYNNDNPSVIKAHYSSIELPESFFYQPRLYPKGKQFKIVHIAYQVSFNSRKGHNQLIEALSRVRRRGYDVSIYFVGGDYNKGVSLLKDYAEKLGVADYIQFTGFLSRPELRNLLISSDLAVLPTKAEGLPRVVIESMAMGLPCISSNVSGNPELLEKDYLLEYSDVDALADAIIRLISNPKEYESVSARNFEKSWKYEAKRLNSDRNDFYNELKNIVLNGKF